MLITKDDYRKAVAERKHLLTETQIPSHQVIQNLLSRKELNHANKIMTYVDFGKEVRTVPLISMLLVDKHVIVPYCEKGEIQLFLLKNLNELAPGCLGILEPRLELRRLSDRRIFPNELELIFVPGIAFDRHGGRIGRGKGYYDRFLAKVPQHVLKIGLAFDCQIFDTVPMETHDLFLDLVITESHIYEAKKVMS